MSGSTRRRAAARPRPRWPRTGSTGSPTTRRCSRRWAEGCSALACAVNRRTVSTGPQVPLTMRVDADVLAAIKASGAGWQTRVNDLLRDAVRSGKLAT
ncbi:BrnA antitoxin family protein [Xylophilus sp.]|uniref:BrnA antitoxin family protein n=1 Tax=Xylophilus sp. TaxID=2653893 RepID=UPI002D7E9263|nr:BrnA antitoxin family protein [Xylophilus sp.]